MSLQGTHTLELDIHSNSYKTIGTCKQYNSAETVEILIYDEDQPINIKDVEIQIRIETPDKRHLSIDTTSTAWTKVKEGGKAFKDFSTKEKAEIRAQFGDVSDEDRFLKGTAELIDKKTDYSIFVKLPQAVFLEAGNGYGEVVLRNPETNRLATMSFLYIVIPSVYDDQDIIDDAYSVDEVTNLKNYMDARKDEALLYSTNAKQSETNAKESETLVLEKSEQVQEHYNYVVSQMETIDDRVETTGVNADRAEQAQTIAVNSETKSKDYSLKAESYAVGTAKNDDGSDYRENQKVDNAKYWYQQAKLIAGSGVIMPMGTRPFEELPIIEWDTDSQGNLYPINMGEMYNISNEFTSDDRFEDGGGIHYGIGSNVYCTSNGLWDVMASATAGGGIMVSDTEPEQNENSIWLQPYD